MNWTVFYYSFSLNNKQLGVYLWALIYVLCVELLWLACARCLKSELMHNYALSPSSYVSVTCVPDIKFVALLRTMNWRSHQPEFPSSSHSFSKLPSNRDTALTDLSFFVSFPSRFKIKTFHVTVSSSWLIRTFSGT